MITLAASDTSQRRARKSREIRLKDPEMGNMEPKLISALANLLDLRGNGNTETGKATPANYARFVVARGYLRQYDQNDNSRLAASELESIAAATPDYAPAQVALSEAYFRTYSATKQAEWLAKSDQAVRRAADIDENDPEIAVMRGRILRATGQTDAAIRELQKGLARAPGNEELLLQLAGAYQSAKEFSKAEATYQEGIRLRPSYFPAYTNLGILYMSEGKWKEAEEPLTIATQLAPEYADGYTNLGSVVYYLDRLDEAQRLFSRSIQLKPTSTAFSNRCAVEFDKRSMDAAVADCRKAVELQPTSALALGNLGDALAESGKGVEARDTYRKAIEAGNKLLAINPASPDLLAYMANFAAKTGQKRAGQRVGGESAPTGLRCAHTV